MSNAHKSKRTNPDGSTVEPCYGWLRETCLHGNIRIIPLFCNKWTCPVCAPVLKSRTLARLLQAARVALNQRHQLRLITLTYAEDVDPAFVRRSLQHLAQALRRRFQLFEYARFPEYTQNGRIHLHLVVLCPFIPQGLLSQLWARHANGAYIVDIRLVKSTHHLANYVTKYLTKAPAAKVTYSRRFPAKYKPPPKTPCPECAGYHSYRTWSLSETYDDGATYEHIYYGIPIYTARHCDCWRQQDDDSWKRAS